MHMKSSPLTQERVLVFLALAALSHAQTIKVEAVANPAAAGSLEVHWAIAQDGSPLLSWIESLKGAPTLYAIRSAAQTNGQSHGRSSRTGGSFVSRRSRPR
jgi:hypothetical protein